MGKKLFTILRWKVFLSKPVSASSECRSSDLSIHHCTPHQYGLRPNKTQVGGLQTTQAQVRSLVEKPGGKSAARGGARTHDPLNASRVL